jgi:glycosyltransferase involved in cell wall biosynthesis
LHAAYVTGVERYARNLLLSVVDADTRDEFVLFGCGDIPAPVPNRSSVSYMGSCAWKSAALRQAWEQVALPRLARKSKIDLLINPINMAPVRFDRNVMVIHDLAFLEHPEWFSGSFGRLYRTLIPKAAERALAVVTISEFSKKKIVDLLGVPATKVHVVYQGIDPTFEPVEHHEVDRILAKFSITKPYILFVGSISPRKNLQTTIAAFAKARKKLPADYTLAVVGANSFQFPETDVPLDTEGVKAVGYAYDFDLPGLYTGADLLVYPSLYEGFGLPPLEAMACGTPVIASNCSSIPEAVGDAALMVDPLDAEALSHEICRVLTYPGLSADLRAWGFERVKQFSWDKTAHGMLDVCRRLSRS